MYIILIKLINKIIDSKWEINKANFKYNSIIDTHLYKISKIEILDLLKFIAKIHSNMITLWFYK